MLRGDFLVGYPIPRKKSLSPKSPHPQKNLQIKKIPNRRDKNFQIFENPQSLKIFRDPEFPILIPENSIQKPPLTVLIVKSQDRKIFSSVSKWAYR